VCRQIKCNSESIDWQFGLRHCHWHSFDFYRTPLPAGKIYFLSIFFSELRQSCFICSSLPAATNCLSYVCNDLQVKVFAPFHCGLLLLIKNTISTIRKISSVLFALAFWLFLLPSDANPLLE